MMELPDCFGKPTPHSICSDFFSIYQCPFIDRCYTARVMDAGELMAEAKFELDGSMQRIKEEMETDMEEYDGFRM